MHPYVARIVSRDRIGGVPACSLCRDVIADVDEPLPEWADAEAACSFCGRRRWLPVHLARELRVPVPYFVSRYGGVAESFNPRPKSPVYLSGCVNPLTHAAAVTQPRLGFLAQPGNAIHRQADGYSRWAIDNGVFGKAAAGRPWRDDDTDDYLAYLARVVDEVDTSNVLFATAPDALGFVDGAPRGHAWNTWFKSGPVFERIRELGLPAALVLQNGVELSDPMTHTHWDMFDAVFIGGSDDFKLGEQARRLVAEAKRHGKWVHMGRVNSLKRLRIAQNLGCDSADGTYVGFGPSKNVPKLLAWLDATELNPTDTEEVLPCAA